MGAGQAISAEQPAANLPQLFADLFDNPAYAENARALSKKYASFGQSNAIGNLVRRVEELRPMERKA